MRPKLIAHSTPMTRDDDRALFARYSAGELTRGDLERQLGHETGFGDILLKLYDYRLPLPRPPYDAESAGSKALRTYLRQQSHGG